MASKKFLQTTKRETMIIIALYLLFFVWWYATAYGFGDDPSQYDYILGFPEWFFYSCIVGYVGISFILWIVIRLMFKDLPLDEEAREAEKEEEKNV
ncbi:MAG: YhdT family protein [Synergistaceae bacterium]|nr:YhdT family protein [Synergistaceae bacterium]